MATLGARLSSLLDEDLVDKKKSTEAKTEAHIEGGRLEADPSASASSGGGGGGGGGDGGVPGEKREPRQKRRHDSGDTEDPGKRKTEDAEDGHEEKRLRTGVVAHTHVKSASAVSGRSLEAGDGGAISTMIRRAVQTTRAARHRYTVKESDAEIERYAVHLLSLRRFDLKLTGPDDHVFRGRYKGLICHDPDSDVLYTIGIRNAWTLAGALIQFARARGASSSEPVSVTEQRMMGGRTPVRVTSRSDGELQLGDVIRWEVGQLFVAGHHATFDDDMWSARFLPSSDVFVRLAEAVGYVRGPNRDLFAQGHPEHTSLLECKNATDVRSVMWRTVVRPVLTRDTHPPLLFATSDLSSSASSSPDTARATSAATSESLSRLQVIASLNASYGLAVRCSALCRASARATERKSRDDTPSEASRWSSVTCTQLRLRIEEFFRVILALPNVREAFVRDLIGHEWCESRLDHDGIKGPSTGESWIRHVVGARHRLLAYAPGDTVTIRLYLKIEFPALDRTSSHQSHYLLDAIYYVAEIRPSGSLPVPVFAPAVTPTSAPDSHPWVAEPVDPPPETGDRTPDERRHPTLFERLWEHLVSSPALPCDSPSSPTTSSTGASSLSCSLDCRVPTSSSCSVSLESSSPSAAARSTGSGSADSWTREVLDHTKEQELRLMQLPELRKAYDELAAAAPLEWRERLGDVDVGPAPRSTVHATLRLVLDTHDLDASFERLRQRLTELWQSRPPDCGRQSTDLELVTKALRELRVSSLPQQILMEFVSCKPTHRLQLVGDETLLRPRASTSWEGWGRDLHGGWDSDCTWDRDPCADAIGEWFMIPPPRQERSTVIVASAAILPVVGDLDAIFARPLSSVLPLTFRNQMVPALATHLPRPMVELCLAYAREPVMRPAAADPLVVEHRISHP
jgi:hypothetical protein